MDYPTLISPKTVSGSLADWVNRSGTETAAPDIIHNAQDELFSRLRVREMRKSLALPLAIGASNAALPSDYLDTAVMVDPYGNKIKRISDDRLVARRSYDANGILIQSYPTVYGVFDQMFQFDCGALAAITLTGMYYGALYINTNTPTNFLTSRYSHLFRAILLKHAYAYWKDFPSAQLYAAQAEQNINDIESFDDLSYRDLDDADMGTRL